MFLFSSCIFRNTALIACLFMTGANFLLAADLSTDKYLRLTIDSISKEPISLDSSIQSLAGHDNKGSYLIDLVSALHVADPLYYAELNKRFASYDSVLFELVASQNDAQSFSASHELNAPKKQENHSQVSLLQDSIARILDLSFQLDSINYSAANFIHVDMSPQELSASMQAKGESFNKMILNALSQSLKQEDKKSPADFSDLFLIITSNYRPMGLKRMLARQFSNIDDLIKALNGTEGSTLIHGRNSIAVKKALERIRLGDRRVAIFYGAAHMPDMFSQLNSGLKLELQKTSWLVAWNLKLVD